MKIGWIVAGKTFEHKGELFAMGLHWNGTLKVWHGMVKEAGHCQATFEKEKAKLESLEGLVFDFVDYDCMRPGNEKWFEEEAKKITKKSKVTYRPNFFVNQNDTATWEGIEDEKI